MSGNPCEEVFSDRQHVRTLPAGSYGELHSVLDEPYHIHPECVNGHDHSVLVHWHVRGGVPHTHRPVLTWSGTPVFTEEGQ